MKIGYSFWGHLSDYKIKDGKYVSTPDGNAFYSWSIIKAFTEAGHEVYRMMPDRDKEAVDKYGKKAFASFAMDDRFNAYNSLKDGFPEDLDVLLLEWRFPIPGRNCKMNPTSPDFQPDLFIQDVLVRTYSNTKTKIIIFDLDYKLTKEDEEKVKPYCVFETSNNPKKLFSPRLSVEIPFDFRHMSEFDIFEAKNNLVYIGNRYERDRLVEKYLVPLSQEEKVAVDLYGNWIESGRDSKERWPFFNYNPRIMMTSFRKAYAYSGATLLLAKDEYLERGFMTARILESLFFGTIPIGIKEFYSIEKYLPPELIANDASDISEIIQFSCCNYQWRRNIIEKLRMDLAFMDCHNFCKSIEKII
jgi:hypothetical protein